MAALAGLEPIRCAPNHAPKPRTRVRAHGGVGAVGAAKGHGRGVAGRRRRVARRQGRHAAGPALGAAGGAGGAAGRRRGRPRRGDLWAHAEKQQHRDEPRSQGLHGCSGWQSACPHCVLLMWRQRPITPPSRLLARLGCVRTVWAPRRGRSACRAAWVPRRPSAPSPSWRPPASHLPGGAAGVEVVLQRVRRHVRGRQEGGVAGARGGAVPRMVVRRRRVGPARVEVGRGVAVVGALGHGVRCGRSKGRDGSLRGPCSRTRRPPSFPSLAARMLLCTSASARGAGWGARAAARVRAHQGTGRVRASCRHPAAPSWGGAGTLLACLASSSRRPGRGRRRPQAPCARSCPPAACRRRRRRRQRRRAAPACRRRRAPRAGRPLRLPAAAAGGAGGAAAAGGGGRGSGAGSSWTKRWCCWRTGGSPSGLRLRVWP